MLLMSRVCAEFHDPAGNVLFAIRPTDRLSFLEAPESIRQDPLFDMLVGDGSIEIPSGKAAQRKLENDPEMVSDAADADPAAEEPVPAGQKSAGRKSGK